ncbi:MAG: YihY/virulence factor BrkB family protein [Ignavibacteria bacterium]|nr:YihY/virulence factor BrkB family protein [Ignavibacteria bacterium]
MAKIKIYKIFDFIKFLIKKAKASYLFFEQLFEKADKHHLFLISSGIALNILLYIMPLFLVAIYILSNFVVEEQQLTQFLFETVNKLLPPNENTKEFLNTIAVEVKSISKGSGIAGLIGAATLLWLSSTLFSSFRAGLNAIFEIKEKKFFIFYKLRDILITILLVILILISTYIFPFIGFTKAYLIDHLPEPLQPIFSTLYIMVFSISVSFLLFFLVFTFIPSERPKLKIRLLSTGMCIVLIELSRRLFGWYLSTISNYGKFYGAYAIIASLAVWVYYLALIIMLSAEFSNFYYARQKDK